MATEIDSLEIKIQSSARDVSADIDKLVKRVDGLEKALSNVGKTNGMDDLKEKAESMSSGMEVAGKKVKKTLEEVQKDLDKKYKDLGKGFELKGSTQYIQKQIDNLSNSLAKAKLKKEELEKSGKTDGQMYEYAYRDVQKYENQLESLKKQLETINKIQEQSAMTAPIHRDTPSVVNSNESQTFNVPASKMGYDAEAMAMVFGEGAKDIKSYADAVEIYGENASQKLNDLKFENPVEKFKELEGKLQQLKVPEVKEDNLKKLDSAIEKAKVKLEELEIKMQNGLTMGNMSDSSYVRLQEQITLAEKKLESLQVRKSELESKPGGYSLGDFNKNLSKLSGESTKAKSRLSMVSSALKKLSKLFSKTSKSNKGLSNSFSGGLKNILKYAFGIRSLFVLVNKLRSAMKDGMKNLVQYSSETDFSVSLLRNSLTQLKNATAAMVSPLLNALAPALNSVIQMCIKATNAVNQLIASLTGRSTWIKATQITDSYANSLKDAGKAAKAALGPFDELNNISISSGSGSGNSGTDASNMFETVNVEKDVSVFADKIKKAWEKADFTEIGEIFGNKIKTALDGINWTPIQNTANKIGKSIATFINGSVEVDDIGYVIGNTVAEGINTGLGFANSFLDNTHWDSIGKFIGDGLNGAVENISWSGIGHVIAQGLNAAFGTLANFSSKFDWKNFGDKISESISTFFADWDAGLTAKALSNIANGILESLIGLFEGTKKQKTFKKIGQDIVDLLCGINWGELSWNMVGFINAFASAVANAPSQLLSGVAQELVEKIFGNHVDIDFDKIFGYMPKIDLVSKIFPQIDTTRKTVEIITKLKEIWTDVKAWWDTNAKLPSIKVPSIGDIRSKIIEKWNQAKSWATSNFNLPSIKVPTIGDILGTVKTKWNQVKNWATSNLKLPNIKAPTIGDILAPLKKNFDNAKKWLTQNSFGSLKIKMPHFSVSWDTKSAAGKVLKNMGFSGMPKFGVSYYAQGGFPEDGWFRANHGEVMGKFDNGKSVVANNRQITDGISNAVYQGNREMVSVMRQELSETRRQNELLTELLEKETGISASDLFNSVRKSAKEYKNTTGRPAFGY